MILGIDPGVSGAVAWLWKDGGYVKCEDMPVANKRVNAAELVKLLKHDKIDMAYLEYVHSGQKGKIAAFSLGHASGVVEGVLQALRIPYQTITPQEWKKHFKLTGKDKDASRLLAQQLYPDAPLGLKKDHGLAEALLIARYGALNGK